MFFLPDNYKCRVCGMLLSEGQRSMSLPHCLEPGHKLHEHTDSLMHWECWLNWEHRLEFAREAALNHEKAISFNPLRHLICKNSKVLLEFRPHDRVVFLKHKEYIIYVSFDLEDYDDWMAGALDIGDPSREEAKEIPLMENIILEMKEEFDSLLPSSIEVVAAIRGESERIAQKIRYAEETEPRMVAKWDREKLAWRDLP